MISRNSHLNTNNWIPKILYLGSDIYFERKISDAFDRDIEYVSIRSSAVASKILSQNIYDVILVDEEIFITESFDGRTSTTLSELYQLAIKRLPRVTFIIFYVKKNTFIKTFEKKNVTTLLYQRDLVSPSRVSFALHFLRRRYYRSLFLIDLHEGQKFDFDIYQYDYEKKEYIILFSKQQALPSNFRDLTSAKHFYVQTSIFHSLDDGIISKMVVTKHFDAIRKLYKYLFVNLMDDCAIDDLKHGHALREVASKIIKFLTIIISRYNNEYHALLEMPYSINSVLGHGINSAIYSLIFSKIIWGNFNEEMAVAGLLHELGLSTVDFHILKRSEDNMLVADKIIIEHHVKESLALLRQKRFKSSPIIDDCVFGHHETLDGMGYPRGLEEKQFSNELRLFSICFYFDLVRCTSRKTPIKGLEETLSYLKSIPCTFKDVHKFDLKMLDHLMIKLDELRQSHKLAA